MSMLMSVKAMKKRNFYTERYFTIKNVVVVCLDDCSISVCERLPCKKSVIILASLRVVLHLVEI